MKYTEKDLYEGMKLRCTDNGPYDFWKKGAIYTVEEDSCGSLVIRGEGDRSDRQTYDILNYLNGEKLVKMEVVKVYKVVVEYKDMLYIKGVSIYVNENEPDYYLRSDQFKYVEQNEEEKEMTNYVEITKLMECTPDEKVIEIGKKYKVLYPTLSGVYIYASKANPKYFIHNEQFKYSFESNKEEKEVPTLEAKADVKEVIQAKIDALTTEAERLFTKRDRLEQHAINLNAKARKLEEVLETIKEFE